MRFFRSAKPAIHNNEVERLLALRNFDVLDTRPEQSLDDLTLLASKICDTPIALISLVDENRQWFKSRVGIDISETPRDISLCSHAIRESETFIIEDLSKDPRFKDSPLVIKPPRFRFYAGAQLKAANGHNLGTLCVIAHEPRKLTRSQVKSLETLASQVMLNLEHKKLHTQSVQRENFLGGVISLLPNMVSYIDRDYRYRYINTAYENWFKLKREDVVGRKCYEILGEGAFNFIKPHIERAFDGEKVQVQVAIPHHENGTIVPKEIYAHFIPDLAESGKIIGMYAVVTDISAIKNAESRALEQGYKLEKALALVKASEKAFHAIFDNSPMGMLQLGSDLRYMAANRSYCEFLGYSEAELKTMTVIDVTHPDDREATREITTRFPSENRVLNRFEKRYLNKKGETIWARVTSRSIHFEKDGEQFLLSVVEDITEMRRKQAELQGAQSQLLSAAKMASLGQMAAGVAHEINNPLAIILLKADQLIEAFSTDGMSAAEVVPELQVIAKTCDRVAKIIKGLRTFSRDSRNDAAQTVTVAKILEETLALCRERFKAHSVELRVKCCEKLAVECRPTEISQILMNLLNNAFDVTIAFEERWVAVDVLVQDEKLKIRVTDSGKGIDSSVVQRLMEPFFTTKGVGKGTGLGLSISKGIAESHHGTLSYDSSSPNTCFVLELPLKQSNGSVVAAA